MGHGDLAGLDIPDAAIRKKGPGRRPLVPAKGSSDDVMRTDDDARYGYGCVCMIFRFRIELIELHCAFDCVLWFFSVNI